MEQFFLPVFSRETAVMRSHLNARGDSLPAAPMPDHYMVFAAAMAPGLMAAARRPGAFISGTVCLIR